VDFEIKLNKSRLATSLTLTRHTQMPEKLPSDTGDVSARRVCTYTVNGRQVLLLPPFVEPEPEGSTQLKRRTPFL